MATETHIFLGSSMIAQAEYDDQSGDLDVTMHNGRSYTVPNVNPSEWSDFKTASSPGGFWHARLKGRE